MQYKLWIFVPSYIVPFGHNVCVLETLDDICNKKLENCNLKYLCKKCYNMLNLQDSFKGVSVENQTNKPLDKEVLLAEYQAAQASAQHHDNLVWTLTGIIWGGMLVLFGFVLGNLDSVNLRLILTLLSILGITMTVAVWLFTLQLNSIKRQKYQRCKTIETSLGMLQHRELKYSSKLQRIIYSIITILFVIAWLSVLCVVWKRY